MAFSYWFIFKRKIFDQTSILVAEEEKLDRRELFAELADPKTFVVKEDPGKVKKNKIKVNLKMNKNKNKNKNNNNKRKSETTENLKKLIFINSR